MTSILIHIGWPKTATTLLQMKLFHQLHRQGRINYFGRYDFIDSPRYYNHFLDQLKAVVYLDDDAFEEVLPRLQEKTEIFLRKDVLNVISDEVFTIAYEHNEFSKDIRKNINRLHRIMGDNPARVLASIRRQDNLVYSFFVEFFSRHLFEDRQNNTLKKYSVNVMDKGHYVHNMYDFNIVIQEAERCFGLQNVHVLVYEWLKSDPNRYVKAMTELLSIEESVVRNVFFNEEANTKKKTEKGYSSKGNSLKKLLDIVLPQSGARGWIKRFLPQSVIRFLSRLLSLLTRVELPSKTIPYLNEELKCEIMKKYEASNRLLNERYDLNLERFGYFKEYSS